MKQLKFIIYILLTVLALASCTDEFQPEQGSVGSAPMLGALSGELGQEQRLGYGYNAACTITDQDAFSKKPILNYNKLLKLEERYGQIFSEEPRHITTTDILTGNTLQELSYSETKSETSFSGFAGCGKTYSKRQTVITESSSEEDVAKIKIKTVVSSRTVDVGMLKSQNMSLDPDSSILAPEYCTAVSDLVKKYGGNASAVSNSDATTFCETFGTHLVVSADLGGVAELQLAIDRNTCIETTHAVQEVQERVFGLPAGSSETQKWSNVDSLKNLDYKAELFVYGGSQDAINAMHDKVSQEVKGTIATSEYRDWAASIVCNPDNPNENNATFVRGRYIPLYELVPEDQVAARAVLTRIYEIYLKQTAPTADKYEPPYGYFDVRQTAGNDPYLLPNSDVRIVKATVQNTEYRAALLCMEYVPSIRSDKPCVVAYPLIFGNDGKRRPYLYNGYFVGDESHRPGVVKWQGAASFYIPSDSIYYGKDTATDDLFDPVSKSLKKLYVYWNNVRPTPCPIKASSEMIQYGNFLYDYVSYSVRNSPITFAKVADTFWSVSSMRCYTENIDTLWGKHQWFKDFLNAGIADITYYDSSSKHYFMLGEGGPMPLTIPDTEAKDFNRKVTKALSRTIAAYRDIIKEMPTREQAKNLGRMLGGRTFIMFDRSFPDNRNILGLDWPDGYRAIGVPSISPNTMQTLDDKAKVILSREWTQGNTDIVPVRIGASGSTTAFDYFEYVSAFNFSSRQYYRYFPIYIVKQDF